MNKRTLSASVLLIVLIIATAIGVWNVQAQDSETARLAILPAGAAYQPRADEVSLAQMYEAVTPSIVYVSVATQVGGGTGSGFVIDNEGHIVTNNHVVEDAQYISVTFVDGTIVDAELVGRDPEADLAVIKVDPAKTPLKPVTFADSGEAFVGQQVYAIGNPYGQEFTLTQGIVSALGRSLQNENSFSIPELIQTDAAINPGNSGGALVDAAGNLVGINSAIYSRTGGSQGIGFAIPVSIARQVMEQIIREGSVTRGWVGIEVQDLTPELAESFSLKNAHGALIAGVLKGGPADNGGVRPGDVLLAVNGKQVSDSASLLNLIAALKPGETARLSVARKQQSLEVSVQAGRRPVQRSPLPQADPELN